MVEANSFFGDYEPINIQWQDSTQETGTITLEAYNRDAMLEFTTQLYEAILNNYTLSTELEGKQYELFKDPNEREAFRVSMSDYYRLTRVF
ncbi:MAG: hypothetical protein AAFN93_26535 [Bacteroidota bacterium]